MNRDDLIAFRDGGRPPIACSLDGADFRQRLDELRAALGRGYLGTERTATGARWRFRAAPGLADHLRALAAREQDCCRFFRFDIVEAGEEIWWDGRVDEPEARPLLDDLFGLPDRQDG